MTLAARGGSGRQAAMGGGRLHVKRGMFCFVLFFWKDGE